MMSGRWPEMNCDIFLKAIYDKLILIQIRFNFAVEVYTLFPKLFFQTCNRFPLRIFSKSLSIVEFIICKSEIQELIIISIAQRKLILLVFALSKCD